ncbi:MAG: hypothetical protein KH382_02990 [Clostridiales bacterium]|nr:hypothetical protein [Clostridiales bacterium]
MKKLVSIIMSLATLLCLFSSLFMLSASDTHERVAAVLVVENGEFRFLYAEEAETYYAEEMAKSITLDEQAFTLSDDKQPAQSATPYISIGTSQYRYGYVEEQRQTGVLCTNFTKRVTREYGNATSIEQTVSVAWEVTQSYETSANITSGDWLKAITAEVGTSWTNSYSVSETYQMTIRPGTKIWLEFTPRMNVTSGTATKYLVTSGGRKPIEARYVTLYGATYTYDYEMKKNIPDGLYVFKEADL